MKNAIAIVLLWSLCFPALAKQQFPKPYSQEELMVRLAKIRVDPERLEPYNHFLKEEIEASMRLEPGVILLYAMSEIDNPANITILEIYRNKEAYQNHIQTPHFVKYKEGTANMVISLELVDATPLIPDILQRLYLN